ncbi:hypothetical protein SAMN06298224_1284 [Fibrobacter sp. UWB16]|uniref:hypothetical protein n=1 Tax=Fibrobacter sp. UWB16 TaxID=1945874 RepID=UPI000BC86B15|nr:hypothetical protein [Fibrobacter sp. UWB16]SOD13560.1 hypothetical protein SAMN06298224_1284 [Fibrobacter sp. UWB16]
MKKQYETPKMNTIDFECKTNLLAGSCGGQTIDAPTISNGLLGLNLDEIDNNKA